MSFARIRTLHVSSHMLNDLIRGASEPVRFTTAPPDLAVVSVDRIIDQPGVFAFVVWSETFDPVPGNAPPPLISFEYMQ